MKCEEVKKLSAHERFFYWINERYRILRRRLRGEPKPWTGDEVLQSWYFTNVRREDDKVTIWFRENIREPLSEQPEVVFATIAFRWFNWPDTGKALLDLRGSGWGSHGAWTNWGPWALPQILKKLHSIKDSGGKVFTGAFNISNSGSTLPKINRVCEDYIKPVWDQRKDLYKILMNPPEKDGSMRSAFTTLRGLPGLGGSGFMAAQVICDLAYTHVLENAPDWLTWCSWGPGSKKGMNRVLEYSEDWPMSRKQWHEELENLRREANKRLRLEFGIELHARDLQNCLCEFSKYERALWGDGRLKRRYPGNA